MLAVKCGKKGEQAEYGHRTEGDQKGKYEYHHFSPGFAPARRQTSAKRSKAAAPEIEALIKSAPKNDQKSALSKTMRTTPAVTIAPMGTISHKPLFLARANPEASRYEKSSSKILPARSSIQITRSVKVVIHKSPVITRSAIIGHLTIQG